MISSQLGTTELRDLLERSRGGDATALERLAESVYARLEQFARQMLRRFPVVGSHDETGDILNGAMLRFLKAMHDVAVRDSRHFYALAAEQIRRELLDLARRYRLRDQRAAAVNHPDVTADFSDADDLERWCAFHEAVTALPSDAREIFEPIFYHDVSQRELAEELGVHPKTVQRRYRAACVRLYESLGGRMPPT
jgi:RNA polymerase sigma factor (sigma-70 family)